MTRYSYLVRRCREQPHPTSAGLKADSRNRRGNSIRVCDVPQVAQFDYLRLGRRTRRDAVESTSSATQLLLRRTSASTSPSDRRPDRWSPSEVPSSCTGFARVVDHIVRLSLTAVPYSRVDWLNQENHSPPRTAHHRCRRDFLRTSMDPRLAVPPPSSSSGHCGRRHHQRGQGVRPPLPRTGGGPAHAR